MKKIILTYCLFALVLIKIQAQQKISVQIPDSKLGISTAYKLNEGQSGFGIRYILQGTSKIDISINYTKGCFFKTNEDYKVLSTSDFDLDAHYKFFKPQLFNLYILGGFNINTNKWVGLYNNSYSKNLDLKGGINAGLGIEFNVGVFSIFAESKTIVMNKNLFAVAGILYHFHKNQAKLSTGKTIQSRSLKR